MSKIKSIVDGKIEYYINQKEAIKRISNIRRIIVKEKLKDHAYLMECLNDIQEYVFRIKNT